MEVNNERTLPEALEDANNLIQIDIFEETERLRGLNLDKSPFLTDLKNIESKLKTYAMLNVFGYNSSKYDLQILMQYILKALEEREIGTNTAVRLLKKGQAYFSVDFQDIVFKDLMSFTSPMSLDKYMRTWLGYSAKLVSYIFKLYYNIILFKLLLLIIV